MASISSKFPAKSLTKLLTFSPKSGISRSLSAAHCRSAFRDPNPEAGTHRRRSTRPHEARAPRLRCPAKAIKGKRRLPMKLKSPLPESPLETEISTPFIAKMSIRSGSAGTVTAARRPSTAVSWRVDPSLLNRTRSTFPFFTAFRNSLYRHWVPSGRSEATGWPAGRGRRPEGRGMATGGGK
ncbi:unnamed protein product [Linum trigynum]|uniref:Uncharacterized protein n=1 Tax=Linum trigynum TaxID=586398 RepID=A0AAV2FSM0_9ROSI